MNQERVLNFANGLKVVTLHMPEKKKVCMMVAVGVGSIHETAETDGAAHFTEHMLFKSNRYRNSSQFIKDIEWNGIQTGAFTDRDCTAFRVLSPSHTFIDSIQITYEAYMNLECVPDELETEREVVNTEIRRCWESPGCHVIHNLLMPNYFRGTDLERNVYGQVNAISNISFEEMILFKKKHYIPQKTVISIAGKFDQEDVINKIEMTFGQISRPSLTEDDLNINVVVRNKEPLYEVRNGIVQAYMAQILPAADRFSGEDYFALHMLENAIGKHMSCRMCDELLEKRGIGYDVRSMYQNHPENCIILLVNGFDAMRLQETRDVLDNILYDIVENGLPEAEIEGVRNKSISLLQDQLENLDDITINLFRKVMYDFPISILDEEDGYRNVNSETLRNAADKYLTKPRIEAGIIPENQSVN
ncbi:MAG: insulinase family protein [Candidatus Aegiribacteria sp.]|nr:insulinase family protein [Candidatus Aegiribacteria sp.]